MKVENIIKIGLITIIIILFVVVSKLNNNLKALEEEKTKNSSIITNYQDKEEDREALSIRKETVVLTAEQKVESAEKSTELGNKICEYQNAYFSIDRYSDEAAFNENVKNLKACFNASDSGSAALRTGLRKIRFRIHIRAHSESMRDLQRGNQIPFSA